MPEQKMILIKSSFTPNFSGIFKNMLDRVLGQTVAPCPEKQKTDIRKNNACITSFAYAYRIRILEPKI